MRVVTGPITGPTSDELQAIARSLKTNRSRNHVRELAAQYDVEEEYVELVAEAVAGGTFRFESTPANLILESASTKGAYPKWHATDTASRKQSHES